MRVVATLTTVPQRVPYLDKVIKSLLSQTYSLDCIYLNLPKESKRFGVPYGKPSSFVQDSVTINATCDIGPITKLYATLFTETDPDTLLFICDCDCEYPPDLVERLVTEHVRLGGRRVALGCSGYIVGNLHEYMGLIQSEDTVPKPCRVDYLQGSTGVLVRRGDIDSSTLISYDDAPPGMHYMDDVWIGIHLEKNGVLRSVIGGKTPRHDATVHHIAGLSRDVVLFSKVLSCVNYGRKHGYFHVAQVANPTKTAGFYGTVSLMTIIMFVVVIINIFRCRSYK